MATISKSSLRAPHLRTGPVHVHVGPSSSWRNAMLGVSGGLVVNPSADQAHPGLRFTLRCRLHGVAHYNRFILATRNHAPAEGKHRVKAASFLRSREALHTMSPTTFPGPHRPRPAPLRKSRSSAPACVLTFNASDPTGAGWPGGDVATIAAMGAHCLPVVTAVILRDTAEASSTARSMTTASPSRRGTSSKTCPSPPGRSASSVAPRTSRPWPRC